MLILRVKLYPYSNNTRQMAKDKILFVSQQITPYLPANPHSTLGNELPQGIQGKGFEVRTFMPRFGMINERRNQLHEVIRLSGINYTIDDNDHPLIIKVATLQPTRMQVYFVDCDDYFFHQPVKELETISDPSTNDERLMFFARSVIETVKKLRWDPVVIQCMGWITALAPLYLKQFHTTDPTFARSKVVFTLLDDKFEGTLDPRFVEKMTMGEFPAEIFNRITGPASYSDICKLAIDYSDAIAVATENPDPELMEYARSTGKPMLEYPGADNMIDATAEFYNNL